MLLEKPTIIKNLPEDLLRFSSDARLSFTRRARTSVQGPLKSDSKLYSRPKHQCVIGITSDCDSFHIDSQDASLLCLVG